MNAATIPSLASLLFLALSVPATPAADPATDAAAAAVSAIPAIDDRLQTQPVPAPESLPEEIAVAVGRFFGFLQRANIDGAYDGLLQGTKIGENVKDTSLLKEKTRAALDMFGAIQGHELIGFRHAGSHLLQVNYLSLGANYPLRWVLYFYRAPLPEARWRLIDIRVDDRLAAAFGGEPGPPQEPATAAPAPVAAPVAAPPAAP